MRLADLAPVKLLIPAIPLVTLAVVGVQAMSPEQQAAPRPVVVKPVKPELPKPPPPPPACDARCMAPAPK